MKKHLKLARILLAVLLVAAMLCPLLFITAEADHDCTGADCAVCHQIHICENLLSSLGTAAAACAAAAAAVCLLCSVSTLRAETDCTFTLVSLKVKLSN